MPVEATSHFFPMEDLQNESSRFTVLERLEFRGRAGGGHGRNSPRIRSRTPAMPTLLIFIFLLVLLMSELFASTHVWTLGSRRSFRSCVSRPKRSRQAGTDRPRPIWHTGWRRCHRMRFTKSPASAVQHGLRGGYCSIFRALLIAERARGDVAGGGRGRGDVSGWPTAF